MIQETVAQHDNVKTEIVQHPKVSYKEVYDKLKLQIDSKEAHIRIEGKNLNSRGRSKFIFPQLSRVGILEFEDFEKELVLIYNKKSTKSSTIRKLLKELFFIIKNHKNEIERV